MDVAEAFAITRNLKPRLGSKKQTLAKKICPNGKES